MNHSSKLSSTSSSTSSFSSSSSFNSITNIIAGTFIESNHFSKIFRLDLYRLLSILNIGQTSTAINASSSVTSSSNILKYKQVKIFTKNGQLMGHLNDINNNINVDDQWLYQVRLASNCFEQNLVATPASYDVNLIEYNKQDCIRNQYWPVLYQTIRPIDPGEELCFWPDLTLSLMLGIPPFLSPINIINDKCYLCHQCGYCYAQPNPLKIHLVLACTKRKQYYTILDNNKNSQSTTALRNGAVENRPDIPLICTKTKLENLETNKKIHSNVTDNKIVSLPRRLHTCSYCGK